MPGKTTATLDRERRDALYELVLNHVNSVGDLWVAMEERDFARVERLGIEYGEDLRLMQDLGWVSTYALARFMDWLADAEEQGKRLSDRTIANAMIPLRAALATAKREGLIRHNPAQGLAMPNREQLPEEEVKVFSRDQLAAVLAIAPERHKPLFELLAATGLRTSEAIASSACTSSSTRASPRSASAAPSSAIGLCPQRASTATATSAAASSSPSPRRPTLPGPGFHTLRHTFASLHSAKAPTSSS